MKAHVIESNKVVNTIEVDDLNFCPNLVEATEGGIGWSYNDGVFTEPADARTDEEKAESARDIRDGILRDTDWRAGSDLTMSDEWKSYRQALRDIPAQAGFPNSITWPTEPS